MIKYSGSVIKRLVSPPPYKYRPRLTLFQGLAQHAPKLLGNNVPYYEVRSRGTRFPAVFVPFSLILADTRTLTDQRNHFAEILATEEQLVPWGEREKKKKKESKERRKENCRLIETKDAKRRRVPLFCIFYCALRKYDDSIYGSGSNFMWLLINFLYDPMLLQHLDFDYITRYVNKNIRIGQNKYINRYWM